MRQVLYTFGGSTTTSVANLQSVSAGASFIFNPLFVDNTNLRQSQVVLDPNLQGIAPAGYTQRSVSLTSTSNASAVNFTITGLDQQNTVTSQTISGPSGGTVYTSSIFSIVQSIAPSTGFASLVSAGRGPIGQTKIFIPSTYGKDFGVGFGVMVTGSVIYTVQHTHDNTFSGNWSQWRFFNHDNTALVNATSSQDSNYAFPVGGIQIVKTDTGVGGFDVIYRQEWA